MTLPEKINEQLKAAMVAKDDARKRTLRAVRTKLQELEKSYGYHMLADVDGEEMKILQKMVKERQDSFAIYIAQSRFDLADPELEEINILKEFLPEEIDEDELCDLIGAFCAGLGVSSMKDMGRTMKEVRKEFPNADGKLTSTIVKEYLS